MNGVFVSTEEFDRILEGRLKKIRHILSTKAVEYAIGTDRMHNFNEAADFNDCTPEQALWGMSTKHLISVRDLVTFSPIHIPDEETVNEKIGDLINYLILLEAIIKTRIANEWAKKGVERWN